MLALIIDEFHSISPQLPKALSEIGAMVEVAHTRGEALWLLEESQFDILIRGGRGNDGEAIAALRRTTPLPILALTPSEHIDERVAVLDAGADDILTTPASVTEILARMRALMRRRPEQASPQICAGNLVLDMASRCVTRKDGVVVELSAREFTVLDLLMRHPRTVLTRTRLIEHMWGVGAYANSNVIDQLISRLRAKIDSANHEIVTVRGVGYRFEPAGAVQKAS